jgi:RNA polymerase sigma-70 factor (ECF subfamily)
MMGSLQDADDMVQETFLRAWRRRESVQHPASLKSWLYSIATHICLDTLKKRPRRAVPSSRDMAASLDEPIPPAVSEPVWLEPYPDALLQIAAGQDPVEQVTSREQITMAFIVALHRLPPRQRAVLLLCDVLDWPAGEVAALLDTTISAVKSALHRARAVLAEHRDNPDTAHSWTLDGLAQVRLASYVRAWEAADIVALVGLLKEDATFSMPPIPAWYRGKETVRALLSRTVFSGQAARRWRLVPTHANSQPAFGLYRYDDARCRYDAYGIQLLTFDGGQIRDITTFVNASLVARFALPRAVVASSA